MSTRRVLIGNDNAGNEGVKCSLPGFDVLTDDDQDSSKFSFNSEWLDIIKVHQVGLATVPQFPSTNTVSFPGLGFTPFFEMRFFSGGTYWNDQYTPNGFYYYNNAPTTLVNAWLIGNSIQCALTGSPPASTVFYVIYNFGYNSP